MAGWRHWLVKKISKFKRFLKKSTKIRNGWMEALA